mmetsp:Transcript_1939/g.2205  ORF Transcript_1939/g.2205 Transcript_1939/m.2205 type:complete len:1317 (+) Transcript_1939:143-4093(+)
MSTYLKTAAMSLLSKTLQTFLTKYLSDVDVEGITLPSYDGSGWGVRLKNVNLRKGVQLMDEMPGKIVKKRIRRKKRSMRRRRASSQLTQETQSERNGITVSETATMATLSVSQEEEKSEENNDHISRVQENDSIETKQFSVGKESEYATEKTRSTNTNKCDEEPNIAATEADADAVTGYYTDEEVEYDSNGNARPTTPTQTSNSMFACFYNRTGTKNRSSKCDSNLNDNCFHHQQQQNDDQKEYIAGEFVDKNLDSFTNDTRASSSLPMKEAHIRFMDDVRTENQKLEDTGKCVVDGDNNNFEDDDNMYEYYEVEEDCEEDYEYPVRLCLGEDGRIGTIDIRLIGKELHVMVEDAIVTIEATPVSPKDENTCHADTTYATGEDDESCDDSTKKHSTGNDTETDNNIKDARNRGNKVANNSSDSNHKHGTTKPTQEPKRDTVGDRVLADNALARIISAIPHLFLRDIRIRLIVRDQPINNIDDYTKPQSSSKDTMIEIGIDFLTVDSGEDVFSHFQNQTTEDDSTNNNNLDGDSIHCTSATASTADNIIKPPSLLRIQSNNVDDTNVEHKNEYLVRHIKTGRGPAAGMWCQLFVPNSQFSKIAMRSASSGVIWARQHWISSTENHLFRCSGIDIQARIYMGTKKVDGTSYSWFYGEYGEENESDYDSIILFGGGMDTIAPGPQLPLPPIEPRMSRGTAQNKNNLESHEKKIVAAEINTENVSPTSTSIHPGADVYHVDSNDVQSCNVSSLFHRISRGMELKSCKDCKHLPSEVCNLCWRAPNAKIKMESPLDSSIPMPGLVVQISVRDPLEINVDRNNIETIGLIKSLFTRSSLSSKAIDPEKESPVKKLAAVTDVLSSNTEDTTQTTTSSTGFFSGLLYGKTEETMQEEELSDSYASYMQPENITVMGVYFSETVIRIHVMREDKADRDLSFCYWQIGMNCLTIDHQSLNAPEKIFQDLEMDIGQLVWDEYRGTNKKNVVSLGLRQLHNNRHRCDSQTPVSSMIDDHAQNKVPWPSTAYALLNIPPPLESLIYKNREGHGLQFRFISLPYIAEIDLKSRSLINLRLGVTTISSSWAVIKDINLIIKEVMNNVVNMKEASETGNKLVDDLGETESEMIDGKNMHPLPKSLMTYSIQIDSSTISLAPLISFKMPMTSFNGERSSLAGFSIESVLEKLELSHGTKEPRIKKGCLSLPQIAQLPESARIHILFCLEDLSSLEKAFNVKKERNSFRRIKAVDKAILKISKKIMKQNLKNISKRKLSHAPIPGGSLLESSNRRQRILTEIMNLDDSELANLWSVHQRYKKKLAKKLKGDRLS